MAQKKSKRKYSQIIGYLGVGDFQSAKVAAKTEQVSFKTEKMLRFMAPILPCLYEIIRIIVRRDGFRKYQADFLSAADACEGSAILNAEWGKLTNLIADAPLSSVNLWAFVCTVFQYKCDAQAEEAFRLYHQLYGFDALPWRDETHPVMHRILTEVMETYHL